MIIVQNSLRRLFLISTMVSLGLLFGFHSQLAAQTIPMNWTNFDSAGNTAAGTLGPLTVQASRVGSASSGTYNMSGASFSAAALGVSQSVLLYQEDSDFSVQLNRPVNGLMVYLGAWRPHSYTFSRPFTILSGLAGATVSGNTLTTAGGFTDGILRFNQPLSFFSLSNPTGSASEQTLTLGVVKKRTEVKVSPYKSRTKSTSITLRGSASATFGVQRVLLKNGRKSARPARLTQAGQKWSYRLRLTKGTNRVKIHAISFDRTKSKTRTISIRKS